MQQAALQETFPCLLTDAREGSVGFEQRGHWQNEESCLVFLGAINSKQLEEGSGGSGFSLSVHQHFGSEGFCCSTEPLLSTFTFGVCVTESARGAGKGWWLWQTGANTTF